MYSDINFYLSGSPATGGVSSSGTPQTLTATAVSTNVFDTGFLGGKSMRTKATIVFNADFVASNTIDMTINGTAIAQQTYATSHAATMTALIAAINTAVGTTPGISAAAGGTTREIILTSTKAVSITINSIAVAAGASQAKYTYYYDTVQGPGEGDDSLFVDVLIPTLPTVSSGELSLVVALQDSDDDVAANYSTIVQTRTLYLFNNRELGEITKPVVRLAVPPTARRYLRLNYTLTGSSPSIPVYSVIKAFN